MAGVQIALDLFLLGLRQRGDLVVQIDHAVVDVDAQFLEQLAVLLERFLVEDLDAVAEHDGVRDLHHGGLHVQREHHAGLACVFDFLFVELQQGLLAHEHAVDHFAVEQADLGLQDDGLAALGDQLHLHVAGAVQRHGLFAVVEVASVHVRDVRARCLAPLGHAVGVLAGVFLDGLGGAAVGVAFTQHGVHGRTDALAVAGLDFLFLVVLGLVGVVGQRIALGLQLGNGRLELRHRSRDVGQLDDVGIRLQGLLAQFGQRVGHALFFLQVLRKLPQHPCCHRDVALGHVDTRRGRKAANDGQERRSGQAWRLVCQGVDDGGLLCTHDLSRGTGVEKPPARKTDQRQRSNSNGLRFCLRRAV